MFIAKGFSSCSSNTAIERNVVKIGQVLAPHTWRMSCMFHHSFKAISKKEVASTSAEAEIDASTESSTLGRKRESSRAGQTNRNPNQRTRHEAIAAAEYARFAGAHLMALREKVSVATSPLAAHVSAPKPRAPARAIAVVQPLTRRLVAPLLLQLAPAILRFNSAGGFTKVKCSDNLLYRVNPVHAFVEPNGTILLDILRKKGAAKIDKIVVLAADATKTDTNARAVTSRAARPDLVLLPLIAIEGE